MKSLAIIYVVAVLLLSGCTDPLNKKHGLSKASRENKNGWIYVHLEGSPADIGYQHG